jgi:hypothetical protein
MHRRSSWAPRPVKRSDRPSGAHPTGLAPAAVLLAGLFAVWAGPLAVPVAAASGDWPQFQGGPTHIGYNATETTLSASNVAGLSVAWTGTTGNPAYSSPAVADGVVYVGSAPSRGSSARPRAEHNDRPRPEPHAVSPGSPR